ncbi:hypothetical protein FB451DRAFT_1210554 [Mycena latifolia]|nr:hypothetical protein FB451DRAFT_1210554 [Mycena latifolia]
MGLPISVLWLLLAAALVNAQTNLLSAHPVSLVPAPSGTGSVVSVHSVSLVPSPTTAAPLESDVSVNPLSYVPAPLSGSFTEIPLPTSTSGSKSNRGKIAGGVAGGLAAIIVAAIGAFLFLRLRRQSKRHWRNRTKGAWQDREGKPSGPVYVGQLFDRPFDGYNHDMKVPVASPTTPTVAPLFIHEPRIAHPLSAHTHASSHSRGDSMEMHWTSSSPTNENQKPPTKF